MAPQVRPVDERFWEKVEVDQQEPDGCWLWRGATHGSAGTFCVRAGLVVQAHRFAWELLRGRAGRGELRRTCPGWLCVRPDHREERTAAPPPAPPAGRASLIREAAERRRK